jgi:hypothetical protein
MRTPDTLVNTTIWMIVDHYIPPRFFHLIVHSRAAHSSVTDSRNNGTYLFSSVFLLNFSPGYRTAPTDFMVTLVRY